MSLLQAPVAKCPPRATLEGGGVQTVVQLPSPMQPFLGLCSEEQDLSPVEPGSEAGAQSIREEHVVIEGPERQAAGVAPGVAIPLP